MNKINVTTGKLQFSRPGLLLAFGVLVLLPLVSRARSPLDRLEPAPVPRQVQVPPQTVKLPGQSAKHASRAATAAHDKVLVAALKGVAFFTTPAAAKTPTTNPGIHFTGLKLLNTPAFRALMAVHLGRPVTREVLNAVTVETDVYLTQRGYPFSVAYLPPQDITDGMIRVVVLLSHVESGVAVEGAKYFSPELYKRQFHIKPNAPLNARALRRDVEWINRNPFRAATLQARPGHKPGTTQLVLKVHEVRPWRYFTGVDNTGTKTTQEDRVYAGFNWGNAFGRGDQLSAQVTTSTNGKALRSISGSYTMDLPWRDILSFSGAYSRSNAIVAAPFSLTGKSWQISANYDIPLASRRVGFTHSLLFGIDFKSTDNNFSFSATPITNNLTHVIQARATWSGRLATRKGVTTFGATVTAAPGNLDSRNKNVYFNRSRKGAMANYVYFRGRASHSMPLAFIGQGFSWSIRGELQVSNHNLIGSEQFQGGGMNSVRGYAEDAIYTDNGVLLSQELHLPPWTIPWGGTGSAGQLRPFLFEDYAHAWNTDKLPGETAVNLHSIGLGFDYSLGQHASIRAAYGWQLRHPASIQPGPHSRVSFSANLSF